ncbi:NADP-dependent malic enzyme [Acidihalobacter ferrooxydans]|nr:NADP-dependent malic enzyme [Acidihalobacter ferrooxydans]
MSSHELLRQAALNYHEYPKPGKLSISATKQMTNQRDLSLAYSPGVAAACEEIVADPMNAYRYTSRGNLVGVISNGTAVLGLGAIGAEASKPVMEGKAVLFKKFADIDVFDIEIEQRDPEKLIDVIAALEPTFGAINLEDIKAPECFLVERKLRERMRIPVFHDDQHGTAIIVAAAVLNGLQVVEKDIANIKVVVSGAGAAALACLDLLVHMGLALDNVWLTDIEGVVFSGRTVLMDEFKARYAQVTDARTLGDVIADADLFLGLSAGGVLKREMVERMAPRPLIFALANPTPEILPEEVREVRPDAAIATGRADYPNQVNNVLCFPFIFRGALDVGATTITRNMEIACVRALADLARQEQSDVVAEAYGMSDLAFGPEYLIPRPFDPRLIVQLAPAVAKAAMDDGVATRPLDDLQAYRQRLQSFVYHSGTLMKTVYESARQVPLERKRVVFAEGEQERVLHAVQTLADEGLVWPILVGRPAVIESRIKRYGLRLQQERDFAVVNPESDERYREYWGSYHALMARHGVTKEIAQLEMRRSHTLIGAMLLHKGEADGLICGTVGTTHDHLRYIDQVLGRCTACGVYAALNALILPMHQLFIVDTHVNADPTAEQIAEIAAMGAHAVRRFGIEPKVALLSHSNFGSSEHSTARKMREALALLREREPELEVDGEMHGDSALDERVRKSFLDDGALNGAANLLVMPNIDAANIAYNLLKVTAGNNVAVGPILLGCAAPAHILTPSATVRRIVNMAALTAVEAYASTRQDGVCEVKPI